MTRMPPNTNLGEARVNITWNGQNGDLNDPVHYGASDIEIKTWVAEAVRSNSVEGIAADRLICLDDFIVDRFSATPQIPMNRIFVRPKTPFG